MFIIVHESESPHRTYRVNVDRIVRYSGGEDGSVIMSDLGHYGLHVNETPEEIDTLILQPEIERAVDTNTTLATIG